jgi:hypothetical protein
MYLYVVQQYMHSPFALEYDTYTICNVHYVPVAENVPDLTAWLKLHYTGR